MSELSVRQYLHNDGSGLTLGYDKQEADKVIAYLENKLDLYKRGFKEDDRINAFLYTELRRHKYKRCLAMAKLCQWKMGVFIYKEEKSNFYHRWHQRWLNIAEKFKPNPTINRKGGTNALQR